MDNSFRSLSYVILFAGLSASVFGIIGFLNTAYADNSNMTNTGMNATVSANATASANMTTSMTGNMTGNMNGTTISPPPVQKMMDPLQQFKSGISANSVQCNAGLTLVIKIEDGSPACVTSPIAQALVARSWGTLP